MLSKEEKQIKMREQRNKKYRENEEYREYRKKNALKYCRDHPEKYNSYIKKYRIENREKINLKCRTKQNIQYKNDIKFRERVKENSRNYYYDHKIEILQKQKAKRELLHSKKKRTISKEYYKETTTKVKSCSNQLSNILNLGVN